jgi:hypothetical protein
MKYLCLGYHEEATWAALPQGERDALVEESFAYADVLRAGGHLIDEKALQGARTAATLRFKSGRMSITDGPYAETKEQLGGFMLLEAHDLNHAIQLMSKIPCMRAGGSIEIRPINEGLAASTRQSASQSSDQKFFEGAVDPAACRSTNW